jgi:dTDP-4-dehydrorhamnose 3,5-epimerase
MKFTKTSLEGVILIEPAVFFDNRGFFLESYSQKEFEKNGINIQFVQDNHSRSNLAGTIRGMHYQDPPFAQSKLLRVTKGKVYDVVLDIRKNSPTFGQWGGFELSASNFQILFIPAGFAHGFATLEPETEVQYKVDNFYSPAHDRGIRWDDPQVNIKWPVSNPQLSEKDSRLPLLREITSPF